MPKRNRQPKQREVRKSPEQRLEELLVEERSDQESRVRAIAGIISLLSFAFVLLALSFFIPPRVAISQSDQLDPYSPLEKPLIIKNNGYFPIEVKTHIELRDAMDADLNKITIGFGSFADDIPRLDVEQSSQIDLSHLIEVLPGIFMAGELSLTVTMRNLIIPYLKQVKRRFQIRKTVDGKYVCSEFASK